jgi:regulation of enolase protein 1 (concanavalin A-like superfamily)
MSSVLLILLVAAFRGHADKVLFRETFHGKLKAGWTWVRENKAGWRIGPQALEIRVEPGNMWGPANDAKNVLVRELPGSRQPIEVSVSVSNNPTEQYEQVDLVCYYDDSHMVKIGFELVDGKRCIVMGREEADRTRTIAIIPFEPTTVELRLVIDGNMIRGAFRVAGAKEWREAGSCDVPANFVAEDGVNTLVVPKSPKVSVQCYQGPSAAEHWAKISNFTVRSLKALKVGPRP